MFYIRVFVTLNAEWRGGIILPRLRKSLQPPTSITSFCGADAGAMGAHRQRRELCGVLRWQNRKGVAGWARGSGRTHDGG